MQILFNYKKTLYSIIITSLLLFIWSCNGGGSGGGGSSSNVTPNVKPLPNSAQIYYESSPLNLKINTLTSLPIILKGGSTGFPVTIKPTLTPANNAPNVSITPNPLIANTSSDVGIIKINTQSAAAGTYTLNLNAIYSVNDITYSKALPSISITVESGPVTPQAGNLSIIPMDSYLTPNGTESIIVNLNGSSEISAFTVTVSANNNLINLSSSLCQLSTLNPSCKLQVTAGSESGVTTISASATNYTNASGTITIVPPVTGTVYYHVDLNSSDNPRPSSAYTIANNQVELLTSEIIAGAFLGHLIHQHNPQLQFDRNYLYGTLIGQWLQEDLQPDFLDPTQLWIDSTLSQRTMLLAVGQGGPFQLNDYSKRLDSGLGLINFIALQQGLGYSVASQDDNSQTKKIGPNSLEYKYFGPIAAAYFHYNDLLRIESLAQENYYAYHSQTSACLMNIANNDFSYLDMVLNAVYNAGPYSDTYGGYATLCANANNPSYSSQLAQIDNYSLNDAQYTQATGIPGTGTFILYPRQIRNYLDQLYNNNTSVVPQANNHLVLAISEVQAIFAKIFSNQNIDFGTDESAPLGYSTNGSNWQAITSGEALTAFNQALTSLGISSTASYDFSNQNQREIIFNLLDSAINNLAANLNINFTATSNLNLAIDESTVIPTCPTNPLIYPTEIGSYTDSSIVKGTDSNLYQCIEPNWCNAGGVYAPISGWAWNSAWVKYQCKTN